MSLTGFAGGKAMIIIDFSKAILVTTLARLLGILAFLGDPAENIASGDNDIVHNMSLALMANIDAPHWFREVDVLKYGVFYLEDPPSVTYLCLKTEASTQLLAWGASSPLVVCTPTI